MRFPNTLPGGWTLSATGCRPGGERPIYAYYLNPNRPAILRQRRRGTVTDRFRFSGGAPWRKTILDAEWDRGRAEGTR